MNRAVSKEFMPSITKSDLVKVLSKKQRYLASKDVEVAVNSLINILSNSLSSGERIEIRGFGSFNLLGSSGAKAQSQSDPFPWRVCTQQQASCAGDASWQG
jgi:hypothetical protein